MDTLVAPLRPPRVRAGWFVAFRSSALGSQRPVPFRLWGEPLLAWRSRTGVTVVHDRCPHRNVPLAGGKVVNGELRCPYHGWRFAGDGACTHVPGLDGSPGRAQRATAFAARESQGFVWVWGEPEAEPHGEPWRFRLADDPHYLTVRRTVSARGSLHMVAENALDVPHTAFVHGGLFRNDRVDRKPIRCVVTRSSDAVECEYVGESRPEGLVGRLLSPSGGTVVHFDRFHLPSIVEVEYRIGAENHVLVNAALTPIDDYETELHAVVSVRTRVPWWLVYPFVLPIALRIFRQDAVLLQQQTERMHAFGGPRYSSTEIDLLGPHIWKLLQRAAEGRVPEEAPARSKDVTLLV
jgi:phenylpropionate dioxygenase-like ring-hydroxylating dioxygenase large terminal subunit